MKRKIKNTRFQRDVEMKKEKGKQITVERSHQETEKEAEEREEKEKMGGGGGERENETGQDVSVEEINDRAVIGGDNGDLPGADDVCPICFDKFTIPCRSNCGHWFCANCILQFWMFRSSMQPCQCPICSCQIVNLEPPPSQLMPQADDRVEVLKKVQQYNGLYISGPLGVFRKIRAFPLFMGRMFRFLMDPDVLRCMHHIIRILGVLFAVLYDRVGFEFMPTGGLGIRRIFNLGGAMFTMALLFISLVYKWMQRRRARRLAAM